MIEKLRRIVESLGYPFFFGTRDEVYAYINSVPTVVACYRQGGGGRQQFFVFKFKGDKPQRMYEEVMREIKRQFTVGVQRVFFYDDVLEARFPVMTKTYTEGGARPTPPPPVSDKILNFTAVEDSTISFKSTRILSFSYSYDGVNYNTWNHSNQGSFNVYDVLTLQAGQKVYIKGNNETLNNVNGDQATFIMTGRIEANGNIMSLLDGNGESLVITHDYCFMYLFFNCASLEKAPEFPATTLSEYCYGFAFYGCTSLDIAPVLPATTLSTNCYSFMFMGCSLLTRIETHATEWPSNVSNSWLSNVAANNGTFYKPAATTIPEGTSGIPAGWTVENI